MIRLSLSTIRTGASYETIYSVSFSDRSIPTTRRSYSHKCDTNNGCDYREHRLHRLINQNPMESYASEIRGENEKRYTPFERGKRNDRLPMDRLSDRKNDGCEPSGVIESKGKKKPNLRRNRSGSRKKRARESWWRNKRKDRGIAMTRETHGIQRADAVRIYQKDSPAPSNVGFLYAM